MTPTKAVAQLIALMSLHPELRTATKYLSTKLTMKLTRQRKHDRRARQETFLLTIGTPNWRERDFIKAAVKAGERFPVKRVQFRLWPKKRVVKC